VLPSRAVQDHRFVPGHLHPAADLSSRREPTLGRKPCHRPIAAKAARNSLHEPAVGPDLKLDQAYAAETEAAAMAIVALESVREANAINRHTDSWSSIISDR